MGIKRFVAANARDAMAQVKRELGADALVLSNRTLTGGRVELLAAGPDDMDALVADACPPRRSARDAQPRPEQAPARESNTVTAKGQRVETFQDFLRRQQQAKSAPRPLPQAASASRYAAISAAIDPPAASAPGDEFAPTVFRRRGDAVVNDPAQEDLHLPATHEALPAKMTSAAAAPIATTMPRAAAAPGLAAALAAHPVAQPGPAPAIAVQARASSSAAQPATALSSFEPITPQPDMKEAVPHQASPPHALAQPSASQSEALQPALPPGMQPVHAASGYAPPAPAAHAVGGSDARLLAELQSMRALLLEQMTTMSAASSAQELQKRSPAQVRVMTRLLTSGFSPEVARHIAAHVEAGMLPAQIDAWLHDVLALNIQCIAPADGIAERGGIYALVGPTGVGKTTTAAKLAARFAVRYGAAQLGLITLDAYRVGAHEQLRTYGRILGAPVHLAQDGATLRELIASMGGKRLVLIDTCGVSQRDERLEEMLAMLEFAGTSLRPVQRVLLLNAASHAETLDAVAGAWRAREAGGAILTKLDEATRIGGAIDVALRHRLVLLGATNGQRVPEDWIAASNEALAAGTLHPGAAAFALDEAEAALVVAHTPLAASSQPPALSQAIARQPVRVGA